MCALPHVASGTDRCRETSQSLRQIAAACGLNTKTVRSWVRTETLPLDQRGYRGAGKIDRYISYLQTRLAEGCTNQSRLWREIQAQGFTGTRSLVAKWIHAHGQHTPVAPLPAAPRLPAARQLAWLILRSEGAESGKRDYSRPLLSEPDVKVSLHPAQASQRPCEGPVSSSPTCWLHDTRRSLVPDSAPRGRRVQLTRSLGVTGKVAPVEPSHRHVQHLLHQFSRGSRAETPQGSLPACASGDVASATGATRIRPITGRRSLFPTPIPAPPLAGLTASLPSQKERYGLTTFPKVDTDGGGALYSPVAWPVHDREADNPCTLLRCPFGSSLSASLACCLSRRLSSVHICSPYHPSWSPLRLMLAETPFPRGLGASRVTGGPLSEGFGQRVTLLPYLVGYC
jgi:hypothetical protein